MFQSSGDERMKRHVIKVLVNMLTLSRIVFAILLLTVLYDKIPKGWFIVIITLMFYTDSIDGMIARKFKVQSSFGAAADTVSDKTLSIGLISILLSKLKFTYLILLGEILIALLTLFSFVTRREAKVEFVGKMKMWFLSFTIILGYLVVFGWLPEICFDTFCIITFGIQLVVLYTYMKHFVKKKTHKNKISIKSKHDLLYTLFSTDYYNKYCK